MKTIILTITCLFTLILINAETYTCSNHPLGGSQYSTIEDAYNAAANGDTILLENTDIQYRYDNVQFAKQLVIIGIGGNAAVTDNRKSIINAFGSNQGVIINSDAAGSEFHGIQFGQFVSISNDTDNITFVGCNFLETETNVASTGTNCQNIVYKNCYFNGITLNGSPARVAIGAESTVTLQNCILSGYISGGGHLTNYLLVDHCLFLASFSGGLIRDLENSEIQNSIFMNSETIIDSGVNSSMNNNFVNNIVFGPAIMPPTNNSGSGNLINTDPLFTNYIQGQEYSQNDDYDVQAGSPAIAAGSDGTDIGLHGGLANFSEAMEPLIVPIVTNITILNPTVTPGGTLNVQIEARIPLTD